MYKIICTCFRFEQKQQHQQQQSISKQRHQMNLGILRSFGYLPSFNRRQFLKHTRILLKSAPSTGCHSLHVMNYSLLGA